jgi:NAD(P)-dependent dehydrogenase (short-subunit alcohol dehydrogenase family)
MKELYTQGQNCLITGRAGKGSSLARMLADDGARLSFRRVRNGLEN